AGGIDLPVDDHHQTDKPPAGYAGPVPAAGWMKAIRREGARILGRVDWTAPAAELPATKGFRFLSPALRIARDGRVLAIKGAGLVHDPALPLTALASQETPMTDPADLRTALVDLLGLPDAATADDTLAAIQMLMDGAADAPDKAPVGGMDGTAMASVQPDPARTVPIEVFHEAMAGRSAQTATLAEERVQTKVGAALRDGHITPGMRDWAVALCRQDEASFDAVLQGAGPAFAYLAKPSHMSGQPPQFDGDRGAQGASEVALCRQLGIDPAKLAD
ncbi:MAG: phage protease, partial [Pseudomonadota bacterium]